MKKTKQWDSELNIGIGLVDNQHKIIFDLIADLGAALEAKADRKVIDTLLDVIENYVFRHFEAEEDLFKGHQDLSRHCLEHYGMIKEFRKLRLGFRNRCGSEDSTSVFLEQWFLTHIKKHDIPLFTSIANGGDSQMEDLTIDEYPFEVKDRRRHKRIQRRRITDNAIKVHCYNTSNLKNSNASIIDMSLGGIRIDSVDRYVIGDLVVASCTIGRHFKMQEKVRIIDVVETVYGAEFINLSPATEKFLIELYGAVNIKTY
jgi:hemerythrin